MGKLKGAYAEILAGRHIDDGEKWATRLLLGASPAAPETVLITFADDSYFERKLTTGFERKARDEARRFNALASLAGVDTESH